MRYNPIFFLLLLVCSASFGQGYQRLTRVEIIDSIKINGVWYRGIVKDSRIVGDSLITTVGNARIAYKLPAGTDSNYVKSLVAPKADTADLRKKVDTTRKVNGKRLSADVMLVQGDIPALADSLAKKEEVFVTTPFNTLLPFDNNYYTAETKVQTNVITFALFGSNKKPLKRYVFSVLKNSDAIVIPNVKWLNDSRFQDGKLNNIILTYLPGDSVLAEINVPEGDHTNMYTLSPGQASFYPYPNYDLYKIEINNDVVIDFSIGITVDGEEIFPLTRLQPGFHTIEIDYPTFTSSQPVYLNGVSAQTVVKIPKPF